MAQVDTRRGDRDPDCQPPVDSKPDASNAQASKPRASTQHASKPPAASRNPYLEVLRRPGALGFSSAAAVGRMSMSMYGLGTILLIASMTGHYGLAGTVAGAGAIGYALCGPIAAALTDRYGQRRVLVPQATIFAILSATFIASAELRAPTWALLVTGTLAGGCMPSVGSMVRSRWSALLADDDRQLHAAFALESVNDELIFVVGPALVTVLATQLVPASGVGAASILCAAGTLTFALQRKTEPAPRARPIHREVPTPDGRGRQSAQHRPGRLGMLRRPSLPAVGLVTLAPALLLFGAMFAALDLSTVAFATKLGHRPLAGLILATYAFGSAIGGLWYGSRHWRAPIGRRLVITATLMVLGISVLWAMPGLLALGAVGFFAGLSTAPTLIASYGILERQAPPHRRTESMAWLSSMASVGVATGSAIAGHVIDASGARWGFGLGACFGALALLTCVVGVAKLRIEPAAEPAAEPAQLGL